MFGRSPRWVKNLMIFAGIPLKARINDRYILEEIIMPYFSNLKDIKAVLFVGCEWYTAWYRKIFKNLEYWTLEMNSKNRIYGSSLHIVDVVENVSDHFQPESLDVIFCNGVLGWGLDSPENFNRAVEGFALCLRPNGVLVLGWDDIPERKPFSHESLVEKYFNKMIFPPLKTSRFRCVSKYMHTFDFYIRKQS